MTAQAHARKEQLERTLTVIQGSIAKFSTLSVILASVEFFEKARRSPKFSTVIGPSDFGIIRRIKRRITTVDRSGSLKTKLLNQFGDHVMFASVAGSLSKCDIFGPRT